MYRMLYSDRRGRIYDCGLKAVGRTGNRLVEITPEDLIELPAGASLVMVPGGTPVGIDRGGRLKALERVPGTGEPAWAVAALLPQGYTRTLLPAYRRSRRERPLPLMGYTAVAWQDGKMYAAARLTDEPDPWGPVHYNTSDLRGLIRARQRRFPRNRLLKHLARCALEYRCFTAQNIFYVRWEGGLPVSPVCNAACLGCISLQPADCCPAPQSRINFRPSVEEAVEVAAAHLEEAPGAIISFGQGCEGEPALAAKTVAEVVKRVRLTTDRGTINMNTNGGYTSGVRLICEAGLDSMRVSMISAREEVYRAYHRPSGYTLADVRRTVRSARLLGVYVSINLLVFPGLTDRAREIEALVEFIRAAGVNKVQLRNLNIDPDFLWSSLKLDPEEDEGLGIRHLLEVLYSIPGLEVGNFSRPVK